jgi:hypothetical protein
LYNLIKLIHGPFNQIDRDANSMEYEKFKTKIDELIQSCFNALFKIKKVFFNTYFNFISFDLQVKQKMDQKIILSRIFLYAIFWF